LETLNFWLNVLKVAFGLGFVIFLHELGHFLLAKWNGVKVEKFSIGFGRTLVGFTKGETEYVLALIPLGGFVKMLGEGTDEKDTKSTDPRAFPNKSVGARMAIISAGVIMNLFLGLACFVFAYGYGMEVHPASVGIVKAGTPAYEAGLKPGDEIVAIDGHGDINYDHLLLKIRLSGAGQVLRFDVKRPGVKDPITMNIEPLREATAEMPSIGIIPDFSLTLGRAPYEPPAGTAPLSKDVVGKLKDGDTLVELGPTESELEKVATNQEYQRLLARWVDRPLIFVFERREDEASGPLSADAKAPRERFSVTLPPSHFVDFGLRMTIEPVASIQHGSPAEKAGFRKGDKIIAVNGDGDFDPMRLPTLCYQEAGKEMTFEVERPEPGQDPARTLTIAVVPDDSPPSAEPVLTNEPLEIPGLGLAYHVLAHVIAVAPDSPAERAGLKKGDTINAMTLLPSEADTKASKGKARPEKLEFKEESPDWSSAFNLLQMLPGQAVQLTVNHSNKPISLTPVADPTWYFPHRGLRFRTLVRNLPPQSARVALKRGFDDSVDNILGIYAMFRSLAQQRVSVKVLGGPQAIAQMAYASARTSWTELIHFLGFLSLQLAVLNFLPIPPLDGGQMAFLIAEKVRGRPLPESAMNVGVWIGIILLFSLMAFVIFQDLARSLFS
jgi:regulator of sigma E protease